MRRRLPREGLEKNSSGKRISKTAVTARTISYFTALHAQQKYWRSPKTTCLKETHTPPPDKLETWSWITKKQHSYRFIQPKTNTIWRVRTGGTWKLSSSQNDARSLHLLFSYQKYSNIKQVYQTQWTSSSPRANKNSLQAFSLPKFRTTLYPAVNKMYCVAKALLSAFTQQPLNHS